MASLVDNDEQLLSDERLLDEIDVADDLLSETNSDAESSDIGEDVSYHPVDDAENEDGHDFVPGDAVVAKTFHDGHLSTIAEESHVPEEEPVRENSYLPPPPRILEDMTFGRAFANMIENSKLQTSETFTSTEFVRGGGLQMQKHEESYLRRRVLDQDDYRFNRTHQERENSWEPSIHDSLPPIPAVHNTILLDKLDTDSHLSVEDCFVSQVKEKSEGLTGEKPNDIKDSDDISVIKTPNSSVEPKVSTPNGSFFRAVSQAEVESKRKALRDMSLNFNNISAILPASNTSACRNEKFLGRPKNYTQDLSAYETLTSSAIGAALSEAPLNDTALISALFKAKARFQQSTFKTMASALQKKPQPLSKKEVANLENAFGQSVSRNRNQIKETGDEITKRKHMNDENINSAAVVVTTPRIKTDDDTAKNSLFSGVNTSDLKRNSMTLYNKSQPDAFFHDNGHSTAKGRDIISRGSCSDIVSDGGRPRILAFKPPFLYFGFVDLGEKVNGYIKLRNISDSRVNLKFRLKSTKGFEASEDFIMYLFQLVEQGTIALHPRESHSVHIIFQPKQAAYFRNVLQVGVLNADHLRYSVPVEGSGGVASLEVKQRGNVNMTRDGSFVVKMQGQAYVAFDLENKGIRDAFVFVIVKDRQTGRQIKNVQVFPQDCAVILRHQIQKFEVHLEADLMSNPSVSHTASASMWSNSSMASRYCVQLLWGQEGQRRRLKRLEELKQKAIVIAGLSFTESRLMNEEKARKTAAESHAVGEFDVEAFELGLRIINISVVDNRFMMSTGRLSEHPCSESVLLKPDETLACSFSNISVFQDVSVTEK